MAYALMECTAVPTCVGRRGCAPLKKKGARKKKQDDSHAPVRKPVWRGGARAPPRTPPTIAAQRFLNGFGEEFYHI